MVAEFDTLSDYLGRLIMLEQAGGGDGALIARLESAIALANRGAGLARQLEEVRKTGP